MNSFNSHLACVPQIRATAFLDDHRHHDRRKRRPLNTCSVNLMDNQLLVSYTVQFKKLQCTLPSCAMIISKRNSMSFLFDLGLTSVAAYAPLAIWKRRPGENMTPGVEDSQRITQIYKPDNNREARLSFSLTICRYRFKNTH